MRAELSGAGKGTKRSNIEDSSDLSPSKKQRKEMMDMGFRDEEDDGEEVVPNLSKTNDRGHVPPVAGEEGFEEVPGDGSAGNLEAGSKKSCDKSSDESFVEELEEDGSEDDFRGEE